MDLPQHINVVSAYGFETFNLFDEENDVLVRLPMMKMPKMSGSVDEWKNNKKYGIDDRLIAIGQAFNGLKHLYSNGFEGYGDLKPSNILYSDFRDIYYLEEKKSWPNFEHPWRACIADIGWADAWVDLVRTPVQ